MAGKSTPRRILSVSHLTARIKTALETTFPSVWVGGELSDVARPRSGHVYLTLKDPHAQIRGVIWRTAARRIDFDLRDGQQVVCHGELDVYAPRGNYQLVIQHIELQGQGALQQALRQLQRRLAAEGLFDAALKKSLPRFPQRIALVTSPTGAAVHDLLEVLRRRWQGVHVLIVPTRVQGEGAAGEIEFAIRRANRLSPPPDVLIVTRGGGSLEDLWCFNEERVVRAIRSSHIPVVSAIGHEIDVTLSDLAADVRALTPSEAAERVVPSAEEMAAALQQYEQRLTVSLRAKAHRARSALEAVARRRIFQRPLEPLRNLARRVDELAMRAERAARRQRTRAQDRLEALAGRLEALGPLAVLRRGYSITQRPDGSVVRDARQVQVGQPLITRLAAGQLRSRVEQCSTAVQAEDAQANTVEQHGRSGHGGER